MNNHKTTKIITFLDANFINLFLNWLEYFKKSCPSCLRSLEIVCFDISSDVVLSSQALRCNSILYLPTKNRGSISSNHMRLNYIWIERVSIILSMLKLGNNVLLTDVDALWLQNPVSFLLNHSSADIISSKGWFPPHLYQKWGSTLCLGLSYFSSSNSTIVFLQDVAAYLKKDNLENFQVDDQYAVNQVLFNWHIRWNNGY